MKQNFLADNGKEFSHHLEFGGVLGADVYFARPYRSCEWILVEAKESDSRLSKSLAYFQNLTKAPFAFQVVNKEPYVDIDCFSLPGPIVVPARTCLSQLI